MVDYVFEHRLSGGIALPANKSGSTRTPIRRDFKPRTLVLAVRQHRGVPATPVVAVGERVRKGQTVAAASSGASAAVHASASGVVRAIEERAVLIDSSIAPELCIVIDGDGGDEAVANAAPWPGDHAAQLAAIRAGGIVGLGGAVYPTAEKLAAPACKTLIVNGAECEPYISCDDMLMRERAGDVIAGALLMTKLLGAQRCIVAIERDKPAAIAAIEAAAAATVDDRLKLAEVPTIYPAGGERQLVELLTGDEVPSGRYPSEFGYVCHNVGTAAALHRLAAHGEPLLSRVVTVTGGGIATPQNVLVPLGASIAELIEFCGGYAGEVARLIVGGSMMGVAVPDDALPIGKAANCVIAATADEIRADATEWPCIRCGDCATACPSRLLPQELLVATQAHDFAALDTLGLRDCIECGSCDVVCPSHLVLTERFRNAKRECALDVRRAGTARR